MPPSVAWWAAAAWGHEAGLLTIAERMGLTVHATAAIRVAYGLGTLLLAAYVMRTWVVPSVDDETDIAHGVVADAPGVAPTR